MKKTFLLLSCFLSLFSFAQVAISTDGSQPSANAMLDIKSSSKGVQFPRITTAQRKAISTTAADAGLMVFDTDKGCLYGFDGIEWQPFAYASTAPGGVVKKLPFSATASANSALGQAVAIEGGYAVVGAPKDTVNGNSGSGSVYLCQKSGGDWAVMTRLVPPNPLTTYNFGYSVAISGDYIAVGCDENINGKNNQGAVYIYMRNGAVWSLQQKLTMPVATAGAYFGRSVSLKGGNLLVGASGVTINSKPAQGTAFVFIRSGTVWTQTAQITADDGGSSDYFGTSVAMEDDYLVIGANGAKVNTSLSAGAAYVYVKGGGTWTKQQRLVSYDPVSNAYFGSSVTIYNNLIVIGSPYDKQGSNECGRTHVYKRNGNQWPYQTTLLPRKLEGPAGQHFGAQVRMVGDYLMVTAPVEDAGDVIQTGTTYLYHFDGTYFRELRRLSIPNAFGLEEFGVGLGFDGSSFLIGAPHMRRSLISNIYGAVYFGSVE